MIKFTIEGKLVKYFDDNWKEGIQIYPMDRLLVKRLALSRKESLRRTADLIAEANFGKNLEQYEDCKTDDDVADLIRIDCKMKGLKELTDGNND